MDGIQENRSTGHVEDETKDGDQQSTKSQEHQRPGPGTEEEPDHQQARTRAQKLENPSGNLSPGRSARTKPDQPKPDPCATEQRKPGGSPVTDEPKPDPLKLHLKHSHTETQKPEDSPQKPHPTPPDQPKQDPHPKEKHNLGESSSTDEPKPDHPKSIPPNPDPLWQEQPKSDPSQDQTQVPPEPTKDLTVFSKSFEKPNQKQHKSRDQQDHHDPPPVTDQTQPTRDQQDYHDPPPVTDQTQPTRDQQDHHDPPPVIDQTPPTRDQQDHHDPPPVIDQTQPTRGQQDYHDPPPVIDQTQPTRGQQDYHDPPPVTDQTQPTRDQQDHHDPPPVIDQTPPTRDQQDHHDPPPVIDQTQTTRGQQDYHDPPPVIDQTQTTRGQQDYHDPPPVIDQTQTTNAPTLAPHVTVEVFCDQVRPGPQESSSAEPKLCGFLQKQGGPLRAWKQRWFTHEEKKNQLFYYRTPQDVTPLGRVELRDATFTYPLKAETGTFHIQTHGRTFTLKALTQELMLYWLQQLQVKRWQHRQTSSGPDSSNNNNNTDDFLPVRRSPLGLVGKDAANASSQRTQIANVSIKHPLIELQNSVHSLRKRSSQELSQSVFHVEAPASTPAHINTTAGLVFPSESRESSSLPVSHSKETNSLRLSTMPVLRRDSPSSSSDRTSHQKQDKQMLVEEVKAQKELVWILHKALEASQLEKRTCAEFLAAEGEQKRLELLRHRERHVADLQGRLEESKTEAEVTRRSLAQRDVQLAELQENIRILMDKNKAKQEVIIKLSDQVTVCMSNPPGSASSSGGGLAFKQLQQENENLKDDIEAYKTQNTFLNSEIYQLTKLWRKSSEQEKSLMAKCAYLEASNCQLESRCLGVLQKLQETKALDPVQRGAVEKMIEDALKVELKSVAKINTYREQDEYGFKIIPDYELDDMKLLAKIQALEIRSHNLLHQEGVERPLLGRWAQYLAGRSHDDLCPSPELKALLRGGVPYEYRQRLWHWMVRARTRTIRDCQPGHYQQLCEKSHTSSDPASRQIQLDLHRTLTSNQLFSSPSSPAFQQLRRILLAFSWQNPAIGYCQGLNRLKKTPSGVWCLLWKPSCLKTTTPRTWCPLRPAGVEGFPGREASSPCVSFR
ncbi:TBC1 domain family member 2A isoform X2 [Limanda limanda]|uniref:TBC1 domain family member 2A isoform X2 n=1 Tax=Limanda limanda TaxID=27771 RepID=UPI0029C80776|nr:TBC1 domain family member 2A isoform X2 [Limanda limanda]